ncbi:MAG: HEAT repeat domain-containing protein, partial [Deltaproteobacteria bacterium]|nr:HEAT repeat domain-containing protein [Deltaproteobacteria bacterium]
MSRQSKVTSLALALVLGAPVVGGAAVANAQVYRPGETSPGTQAPRNEEILQVLERGAPDEIYATLEYAERVECQRCMPVVERNLYSPNARVREISAWWLRRRIFGFAIVFTRAVRTLRDTTATPERRSYAADALGEFMDRNAVPVLSEAFGSADAVVRASIVRALGRLNQTTGYATIVSALGDTDANVRREALAAIPVLNFFRQTDALLPLVADADDVVRRRATLLLADYGVEEAVDPLITVLNGDASRDVRQAAAFALGRLGGSAAREALRSAQTTESDSLV